MASAPRLADAPRDVGHGHLGAEVARVETVVPLEPVVSGEPLRVEDRVQAHGVRVGLQRAAQHDQPAVESPRDLRVDLLARERRRGASSAAIAERSISWVARP